MNSIGRMLRIHFTSLVVMAGVVMFASASRGAPAQTNSYIPFTGGQSTWHDGFERHDYLMDEESLAITPFGRPADEKLGVQNPPKGQRRCIVVVPKEAAPGRPWSWQGCYWNHEPQTEVELLRRGFHIVFITPDPGRQWEAWYAYLTEQHGLSRKPAFVGMSKGGVNEYDWATANPTKVACLYADNPAIRPEALARLGELARNDVALLNVCGSQDFLLQRHTLPIEDRYLQLGGQITVMIKDGPAHHPHSLRNPKPIADWIVLHTPATPSSPDQRPAFAGAKFLKTYYYSPASTNVYLAEENTYANCRGPGFVECYDRYDAPTDSQWGLTGLCVIVPKVAASGKPWVFRANAIDRQAGVDQALLARGYHIVIPPLTAQTGPQREQWDDTYNLMIKHGFSPKPVLEGTGTSAGEAYAWAVDSPEKVSAVYGRNPALRSLGSKSPLVEKLSALAKAGVPIVHLCDKSDPWLPEYTQAMEKRFTEMGGKMTVVITDGDGRRPPSSADELRVADLLAK